MRKVALRGLFVRKTRLALTTLAVALGVTLIAGTYVFTDTINHSFDKIFAVSFKGTDVVISPNDDLQSENQSGPAPLDASILDDVRRLPGVAQAEGSIFDQNGAILDKKGKPVGVGGAPTFVAGTRRVERFNSLEYAEGRPPRTAGEVAIDKALADRKHFKVGQTLDVQDVAPRKTYTITGLVRIAGVDSLGGAAMAVMTPEEAARISGKQGKFDEIDLASDGSVSAAQLRDSVRRVVPPGVDVRTGSEQASNQSKDIRDNLGFLQTALLAFAGISLFVGAFIIFNTFSITVAQRAREFALLRTLGARRGQVLRSVLAEGLTLGIFGSAAGLGLGVGAASVLRALFKSFGIDLPSTGTVVETRTITVSLIVGTVVTVIASLAPALRATRVPPVAALREGVALPETRS
jgi:putative ABC transport system permease protein